MTKQNKIEEKEMVVITDIWAGAPKEATHYSPPTSYTNLVYWLIEDGIVERVWVEYEVELCTGEWYEDQGYSCVDYTPDEQPNYFIDELISRPSQKWIPRVGDTVLYKRTGSLDFAWDTPVEVHVVAVQGSSVWISNERWDIVADIGDLQPKPTVKTLEERLNEVINPEGLSILPVSTTVRRLMEAGVVFKG